MHIASSTAGYYPVVVPNTQKPSSASPAASTALLPAQGAKQLAPNATLTSNSDDSRTLLLARQRAGEVTFVSKSATEVVRGGVSGANGQEGFARGGLLGSAQRAVAEYANVATQQHREEVIALFGIDEFA